MKLYQIGSNFFSLLKVMNNKKNFFSCFIHCYISFHYTREFAEAKCYLRCPFAFFFFFFIFKLVVAKMRIIKQSSFGTLLFRLINEVDLRRPPGSSLKDLEKRITSFHVRVHCDFHLFKFALARSVLVNVTAP